MIGRMIKVAAKIACTDLCDCEGECRCMIMEQNVTIMACMVPYSASNYLSWFYCACVRSTTPPSRPPRNYLTSDCTEVEDAVSQSSPLLAGNVKYSGTNQFYAGTPANWSICTGHLYWVDLFLHALLPCLGPSSWSAAVQQRDGSTFVASVGWIAVSILGLPCVQWSRNIYIHPHTCTHTPSHTHTHPHTHALTHTHTHPHTHALTHTHSPQWSCLLMESL